MMLLRSLSLATFGASLWLWTGGAVAQEYVPAADEATLKDAGLKTDGPALLDFFRKRTLSEADKAKLAGLVRKLGDPSFKMREQASASLLTAGRSALPFLRSAVKDPDLELARRAQQCVQAIESRADAVLSLAAARLLAVRRPPGTVEVILKYLPFADDENLEDDLLATLAAAGMRDGKAESAILASLQDPLPVRRAAAAWIVGRSPHPAH